MVTFATRNHKKLEEIRAIIPNTVSMEDVGLFFETVEDGNTYIENAYKKAKAVVDATGKPALADDSGVEIAFLDGKPGLHAADYLYDNTQYRKRNEAILAKMQGVENRAVTYVCTMLLLLPTGEQYVTHGELKGDLATEPRGDQGFAYDELMIPQGDTRTLAEMSLEEKNKISHRNIALRKMQAVIEELGL